MYTINRMAVGVKKSNFRVFGLTSGAEDCGSWGKVGLRGWVSSEDHFTEQRRLAARIPNFKPEATDSEPSARNPYWFRV